MTLKDSKASTSFSCAVRLTFVRSADAKTRTVKLMLVGDGDEAKEFAVGWFERASLLGRLRLLSLRLQITMHANRLEL